jgi:4-diphosphocytidyl-2-C-methyl-D-erythritol kinase
MREAAYAKLNLALHVRGREADGYHRLETLFAFCEDGEALSVAPGEGLTLRVEGPFGDELGVGPDNLVLRAANALRRACSVNAGAALLLDKRLPVAAGVGGGSADAAAALRLLRNFWSLSIEDEDLHGIAAQLGADVPACLQSRTLRGEGRGERLSLGPSDMRGAPVLLVNARVALSTPDVFRAWDGVDRGPLRFDSARSALIEGRNDLEAPAIRLAPIIADVLGVLRACSAVVAARMSGSGATCFAVFTDEPARNLAAQQLGQTRPHWWMLRSRLR